MLKKNKRAQKEKKKMGGKCEARRCLMCWHLLSEIGFLKNGKCPINSIVTTYQFIIDNKTWINLNKILYIGDMYKLKEKGGPGIER